MPDSAQASLRFAVLGDSVAWGQGLLLEHKYSTMVAAALGQPPGNVGVEAHSGAVIGIGQDLNGTSRDPEVPAPAPKIVDQAGNFDDPGDIDVVIMDGGINDVDIMRIFNPLTPVATIQDLTYTFCYYDMLALLGRAVSRFTKPTCRFVIHGYYPILSFQSRLFENLAGTDSLAKFLSVFAPDFPLIFDRSVVVESLIEHAQQFYSCSQASLAKAVADARVRYDPGFAIPLANRMAFVGSGFTDANALFTGTPLLWGFQGPNLDPEDEVIRQRGSSCACKYGEPWDLANRVICEHASVGHPNVAGAEMYAEAIVTALRAMPPLGVAALDSAFLPGTLLSTS